MRNPFKTSLIGTAIVVGLGLGLDVADRIQVPTQIETDLFELTKIVARYSPMPDFDRIDGAKSQPQL